jgi:hypothetical protein
MGKNDKIQEAGNTQALLERQRIGANSAVTDTPSASMLFSLVRHCSEDSIKSTCYLAECIYLFTGVRQN